MDCEYCGEQVKKETRCRGCGATATLPDWERSEPFEYNGFVVYALKNYAMDAIEFCFYRGRYLEHKVIVLMEEIIENVRDGDTMMPYVMEKLESGT